MAAARILEEPESAAHVAGTPPPLKWAGGKRWQMPHLLPYWRPLRGRRLVEPFAGGLAVALGILPARALLNDVNPHLINFYRWLKQAWSSTRPVILANQTTARIRDVYRRLGFSLRALGAPRRISCTGDRRPAVEVLAIATCRCDSAGGREGSY